MVKISFDDSFQRIFRKIKDNNVKGQIIKLISKIKSNPKIGKPMKYSRKGTRELYVGSFRLSYAYNIKSDSVIIFNLYHKKKQ